MAYKEIGVLQDATNARIMDAIRNDASLDYQRRIPEATKGGIDSAIKRLTEYRPAWNEFENALVNRIGLVIGRSQSWTNPLAEFKQGLLTFGDTIEEYQVGLLKAHTYDPDRDYMEKAIFGRELPEVQTNFHRVNRQDFYKITVQENLLRRAFLDEFGLSAFVSDFMNAPLRSDQWDEFLLTCRLFAEYESNGGFHRVNVPDIANIDSTPEDARLALRKMRGVAESLTFLSTRYNAAHMPTFAKPEELVLFTTPEFRAAIDVEALAGAFNIERANVPHRIITVPEEQLGIDGGQAVLTTTDFFIIADQRLENTSQFNPISGATNYFWNHWQVISASRFVPSVLFTTKPGDEVIEVQEPTVKIEQIVAEDVNATRVTAVERGMTYQLYAADAAFTLRDGASWSLTGADSTRTRVSATGVLFVAPNETSTAITVSAFNPTEDIATPVEHAELVLTVSGEIVPEWPVIRESGDPAGRMALTVNESAAKSVDESAAKPVDKSGDK